MWRVQNIPLEDDGDDGDMLKGTKIGVSNTESKTMIVNMGYTAL